MSHDSGGGPEGPPSWEKALAGLVASVIIGVARIVFTVFKSIFRVLLSFV